MATSTALASPPPACAPTGRSPSNDSLSSAAPAGEGVHRPACSAVRLPPELGVGVPAPSFNAPS
eukprot:2025593-Pleurochrysis_carterae.AAC.1